MQNCLRLTTLSKILDVDKKTVRKWTSSLEPLSGREKQERKAEEFSSLDLLFLEVIGDLTQIGGVSLEKISEFSEVIYLALQRPSNTNSDEITFITATETGWLVTDSPISGSFCYCLSIGNARKRVLAALGVGDAPQQHQLNFGLSLRRSENR
jgi:hypothetical protein